jgi:hypothetical protein
VLMEGAAASRYFWATGAAACRHHTFPALSARQAGRLGCHRAVNPSDHHYAKRPTSQPGCQVLCLVEPSAPPGERRRVQQRAPGPQQHRRWAAATRGQHGAALGGGVPGMREEGQPRAAPAVHSGQSLPQQRNDAKRTPIPCTCSRTHPTQPQPLRYCCCCSCHSHTCCCCCCCCCC